MELDGIIATVTERLVGICGLHVSEPWLRACLEHIGYNHTTTELESKVLHQILHSDLRTVVNPTHPSPLRNALLKSIPSTPTDSTKELLAHGSKCLLQIEELIDVSRNAETRYAHGPTSINSPTPVGNQRGRCLKLAISDGSDGGEMGEEEDVVVFPPMIAMELSPIQNLSVQSLPGIKILVHAGDKLDKVGSSSSGTLMDNNTVLCRCGVAMLHDGNTTVLGGCIPSLIPVQKKAIELANRMAGVGIDPTVRALIWNPETGLDDENDEGEEQSGDVRAPPPRPPPTTQNNPIPPPNTAHPNPNPPPRNHTATNGAANTNNRGGPVEAGGGSTIPSQRTQDRNTSRCAITFQQPQHETQQQPISRDIIPLQDTHPINRNRIMPLSAQNDSNHNRNGSTSTNTPKHNSTTPPTTSIPSRTPRPTAIATNPYASRTKTPSSTASGTRPRTTLATTATASSVQSPSLPLHNLPSSLSTLDAIDLTSPNNNVLISTDSHTSNPGFTTASQLLSQRQPSIPKTTPSVGVPSTNSKPSATTTPHKVSDAVSPLDTPIAMSPTLNTLPMSFTELKQIVNKITLPIDTDSQTDATKTCREVYQQYEHKTFVIPSKMKKHLSFNIVKPPKDKGKKSKKLKLSSSSQKKYEYLMTCSFVGTNDSDGAIHCQIHHTILDDYFSLSADELRKLSKTDKTKAQEVTRVEGAKVAADICVLSSFRMRLLHSVEDYFSKERESNTTDPILLVTGRNC